MTAKSHETVVADQFGPQAAAYVASAVHAQGEDLEQGLAVVAGRREPGLFEHLLDLLRQQRDVAGAGLVGGGGV